MASSGGKTPEGISAGPPGERGADGNTIHSGEGTPSSGLGINGDYYIDKVAHTVYGPKTGGAWGSSIGLVGERGEKGLTGAEGSKGATGSTGATGVSGPSGSEGPRGLTGDKGATGVQGEKGTTGATGETGSQGLKGEKGSTGLEGPKGSTGSTGVEGPEGPRGEKGETGAKGSVGSTGSTGVEGAKGSTGEQGPKGTTGSTGPAASLGEWKAITLETGITNKGSPSSNAQYVVSSIGVVYLRGVITNSGLLSVEATIAKLPESAWPGYLQTLSTNFGTTVGNLLITKEGSIKISAGVGIGVSFSLDGLFYPLI